MEGGFPKFLEMHKCYTICLVAYRELMTFAVSQNSWVQNVPALGELEAFQSVFRVPPSPGRKIEYSVATGILPVRVEWFINIMTNVNEWNDVFRDIVHCETCEMEPGVMSGLVSTAPRPWFDPTIKSLRAINAELLYPMPCGPSRKFSFIRFVKEVMPDVFAVVDVSTDYFPHFKSTYKANCKRRPSGVIVRKHGAHDEHSEAIWIENMEVPECNLENSVHSGVNLNLAFDGKRWMSMISNHEKWIRSKVVTFRLPTSGDVFKVRKSMLALGKKLRTAFMSYIAEYRIEGDKTGWDIPLIPEDGKCNIWEDTTAQGNKKLTVLTTIRVKATPRAVFTFLVERTPQLQWPRLVETAEREEVINYLWDDDKTFIVHAKNMRRIESGEQTTQIELPQDYQYVLQEASLNKFCSLVISSIPLNIYQFNSALLFRKDSYSLTPSGFSIIPVGSQGLLSDASIITMVSRKEFYANVETREAVERMRQYAKGVINVIRKAFTAGDDAMEP